MDLPCNGVLLMIVCSYSSIGSIGEWWREHSDGRWTGHGCWGQENMNRELNRSYCRHN